MNGYVAAVRQFYDIYRPIARKYGLRMSSHTSIYDDGWIKIYKGEGADRQQIIKIEEKKSENNMLFLAAVACVATAQTMWKRQTHAQEK